MLVSENRVWVLAEGAPLTGKPWMLTWSAGVEAVGVAALWPH